MYDAIIIGASVAGAPTAMLLARKGYRVLLLDRSGFASDRTAICFVHQAGGAHLARWGLLDRIRASNCPPIRQLSMDVGSFALVGTPPPVDGAATAYAPRGAVLDTILVTAAIEAGVELREHFTVRELLGDGVRVTGIRGHSVGGATVSEHARIVIGADGVRSYVARSVQAPPYRTWPARTCAYASYWNNVPLANAELFVRPNRWISAVPTNDGQSAITVAWPNTAFQRVRGNVEAEFMQALELAPDFAARVRRGERGECFDGSADLPSVLRKPYGPGWALVGDAGAHQGTITAQASSDAFRDAALLAHALDDGWSGNAALGTALAGYEQHRNAAAVPMYEFTYQLAGLAPAPELQQLFGALRNNQQQTDRFVGVLAGSVAPQEVYPPTNIERAVAAPRPATA